MPVLGSQHSRLGILLLAIFGPASCGADSTAGSLGGLGDRPAMPSPGPGDESGNGGADAGLPPEKKIESRYQTPVATGRYVWIANPVSGTVAYVDATSLVVKSVAAGHRPTTVAALPGQDDAAIVLNVGSKDATVLRATGSTLASATVALGITGNRWSLSGDGRWAIAWTDEKLEAAADPTSGFQDICVVDTTGTMSATRLTVGYRPGAVTFASDGRTAYVPTRDGVTTIDLSASVPRISKHILIGDSDFRTTDQLLVAAAHKFVVLRPTERAEIRLISLETEQKTTVPLDGVASDLALSNGGDTLLAVLRDKARVALVALNADPTTPSRVTTYDLPGETIGTVTMTDSGTRALLYTTAAPEERLSVLELGPPLSHRTIRLHAPLLAALANEEGTQAIAVHDKPKGSTAAGAFSLVALDGATPARIESTRAPITSVAMGRGTDRAVLVERSDTTAIYGAYIATLGSQAVTRVSLTSPPTSAGIVRGANRAFVAQEHTEGRITFIDLTSGTVRTLTGFELGARIADGSGT